VKHVVLDAPEVVGAWVMEQQSASWWKGRGTAIGYCDGQELVAGVVFENWNRSSLCMHIAALPGRLWATRAFLVPCFQYPFNQLGCKKVIAQVGSSNEKSRRFVEHVGFTLEATLKDAYPDGDLLLYTMTRAECRWLTI
jgi:RimJ/RimL family protein N-acetyltransferase